MLMTEVHTTEIPDDIICSDLEKTCSIDDYDFVTAVEPPLSALLSTRVVHTMGS